MKSARLVDPGQFGHLTPYCPVGIVPREFPEEIIRRTLVQNLSFAAKATERWGIRLLIEALSSTSLPDFYLNRTQQSAELIDEVGSDSLHILYDAFHMQIMEGNLAITIQENLPNIGDIQIADNPGRHEPGTGEINFINLLRFINEAGYDGWVGCEYIPLGDTLKVLNGQHPI